MIAEAINSYSPRLSIESRFCLALFLTVLLTLVLSGCGKQDRLDPGSPEPPDSLPLISWGTFQDELPPIFWNSRPTAVAGWSGDDFLLGMGNGVILRKTGDLYRRVDLPQQNYVVHLHCRSDGTAWCLDSGGGFWLLDGDRWNLVRDLPGVGGYTGFQVDSQDRMWVYGGLGVLWRRTAGDWMQFDLPDTLNFCDGWIGPDDAAVLVSEDLDVLRMQGESWEVETLTWPDPSYARKMIEGDGAGRLAVAGEAGNFLWLYDGSTWTRFQEDAAEDEFQLADVFWLDGELYGLLFHDGQAARWDGGNWIEKQDLPGAAYWDYMLSSPIGEGRLIGLERGAAVEFYPGHLRQVSGRLDRISAVAQGSGGLFVAYYSGEYMRKLGDSWQLAPRVLDSDDPVRRHGLVVDSEGGLTLIGNGSVVRVVGDGAPEELTEMNSISEVYPQDNGSAIFTHGEDVYEIAEGKVTWLASLYDLSSMRQIARDRNDGLYVLQPWRLLVCKNGAQETLMTFTDWYAWRFVLDSQLGMGIYGNDRVLLESGDDFVDVSPWAMEGANWERLVLYDICPDGQSGWLGACATTGEILHFDGEDWARLDHTFPEVADVADDGLQIVSAGDGSFLIFNESMVQRLTPEGGMP
jgi:hypothetical protein